jgi:predicted nucleic acid-binding protein
VILADTSIWIDHLRRPDPELARLLTARQIVIHPLVRLELALGSIANRDAVLASLAALPHITVARTEELFELVERRNLSRRGVGITDLHLIAACLLTPETLLWTRDKQLAQVASALGVNANLP